MSESDSFRLAMVSDVHFGGPAETARRGLELDLIASPFRRWLVRQYRRHIWLKNPCAHNHQVLRFLRETRDADLAVANGDFACDFAAVGVMDAATFESASLALDLLRGQFGDRLRATIGDHELGKKMLAADVGGLRLASWQRATTELRLQPFWRTEVGAYVVMGITSTLVALPVYEQEALPAERDEWRRLRDAHLAEIRAAFSALDPQQRVLLFCHDPSALPFLFREASIREHLPQVERTVIGHLHSPAVLRRSQMLAGMPCLSVFGHTIRRLSTALHDARIWREFRLLLCPSLAGLQCLKDGGFYVAELDRTGRVPAQFHWHPLPW